MHGGKRPAGRVNSADLKSDQVPDGLDDALVDQVEEAPEGNAGKVNLCGRDLPRFLGFLIEISNQTCSLLDSAAVAFLLLRCHVDRFNPATSPL